MSVKKEGDHRWRASLPGKQTTDRSDIAKYKIGEALRNVQRSTGCTTRTLATTLKELKPFLKDEYQISLPHDTFRSIDKGIKAKYEAISLQLHGCVGCNKHVFLPSDKAKRCPLCRFPRHNIKGQPNEVSIQCI